MGHNPPGQAVEHLFGRQLNCRPNLASPLPWGEGLGVRAVGGLAGCRTPPSLQFSSGTNVLLQGNSRVSYSKFKIVLCLIALAAALAWASNASSVCLVSYPGPTTFDGIDDAVVLPSVSIGLEGTVSLQFKANDTAGMHGLWYCSDKPAPVPGSLGEYRILLDQQHGLG